MKLDIMRMGTKSSGFVYQKKVTKHGTHDQSSHNPHKGGRGSLAGGTRYTPEEIKDIYAAAEFELSDGENSRNRVKFAPFLTVATSVADDAFPVSGPENAVAVTDPTLRRPDCGT